MEVHIKVTIWKKIEISDDVPKQRVVEVLKAHGSANDLFDIEDEIGYLNYDDIEDTEEDVTVEDNGGCSTLELKDEDGKTIWWNGDEEYFENDGTKILKFGE